MAGIDPRLIFQHTTTNFNPATSVPTVMTVSSPDPSLILGAGSIEPAETPSMDAPFSVPQPSRFYYDPIEPTIIRSTLTTQHLLERAKAPTWTDCIEATISESLGGALNCGDIIDSIVSRFAGMKKRVPISCYLSQSLGFEHNNDRLNPIWHLTGKETRIVRPDKVEKRAEKKRVMQQESSQDTTEPSVGPHRTVVQKKKAPPAYSTARSATKNGSKKSADSEVNVTDSQSSQTVEPDLADAFLASALATFQNTPGSQSPALNRTPNNIDPLATLFSSASPPNPVTFSATSGTPAYHSDARSSLPIESLPFSLFPSNDTQWIQGPSTSQLQMNGQADSTKSLSPVQMQDFSIFPSGPAPWGLSLPSPSLSSSSGRSSALTTSSSAVSSPQSSAYRSNSTQPINHMQTINASEYEWFPPTDFNPYTSWGHAYQDSACGIMESTSSQLPCGTEQYLASSSTGVDMTLDWGDLLVVPTFATPNTLPFPLPH